MSSTTRGPFFFAQVESRNISTPKRNWSCWNILGGECCLWTTLSTFSQSRGPITLMTFKRQLNVTQDIFLAPSKQESLGLLHVFLPMKLKKTRSHLAKRCGAPKKTRDLPTLNQNMISKYWGTEISGKNVALGFFWRHDASISAVYWSKSDEEKNILNLWIFTQNTLSETNIACEKLMIGLEGDPFLLGFGPFSGTKMLEPKNRNIQRFGSQTLGPIP